MVSRDTQSSLWKSWYHFIGWVGAIPCQVSMIRTFGLHASNFHNFEPQTLFKSTDEKTKEAWGGRGVITFPELMATSVMITSIQLGNMVAAMDLVGGGGEGNKSVS